MNARPNNSLAGREERKVPNHNSLNVLIVCEHASARFGGEAILPLQYFQSLRHRGVEVRLISHERTRYELLELLPEEADRMYFIPDTAIHKIASRLEMLLPAQVGCSTVGLVSRLSSQWTARKLARRLIKEHGVNVVHQPIPVSPREPSLLHDMGASVIIGPMNGDMSYPPAFAAKGKLKLVEAVVWFARLVSGPAHRFIPGKLRAAALLVANERTRAALPAAKGQIIPLVENGVDLGVWSPRDDRRGTDRPIRFIFLGRLVELKAIDLLLDAFAQVPVTPGTQLDILGEGPLRTVLQKQCDSLGLRGRVHFHGWLNQNDCAQRLRESDVLVFPSIHDCGGAVVLQGMACGLPVIATAWGGPIDYLDSTCGILVAPESREALVRGFADAMKLLASDANLRARLGRCGRERVEAKFGWDAKIDQILAIYHRVAFGAPTKERGQPTTAGLNR